MSIIRVKAKPGRVAFTAPRGGRQIPYDKFVEVDESPWIVRLLEHHGDIEREPEKGSATKPVKPVAEPSAPAA